MVSLQRTISTKERSTSWTSTVPDDSSKKRKRGHDNDNGEVVVAAKELKLWSNNNKNPSPPPRSTDLELHLEDFPLPPEWQRCLDIKSGRIHFYNTRTHVRTTRDPRRLSPKPEVSLDLELNLGCESPATKQQKQERSSSTWVSAEADDKEMMAGVCMRCHMLVMMLKSSPSCPNCKYLHPPVQPPALVKSNLSLLCCKD